MPIIISINPENLEIIFNEYKDLFGMLDVKQSQKIKAILWDARFSMFTCILAGLGRALSEVGAIIIVGGNIIHFTRVMTTTIALETSKGNLSCNVTRYYFNFYCFDFEFYCLVVKNISVKYSYN